MQASETKLQQIIEGTKQYVVPLFQRAYSWKKPEWKVLWDDIIELCEMDNPRAHFMGSIVTIPTASVPEGVGKYLLIDGQQRLTTVFILLSALRDSAKQCGEDELATKIDNTILVNPYEKGLDKYKLQPTQSDRTAFHQIIDCEQATNSGISECYSFFQKKIRQNNINIEKVRKIICTNLSVVSVVLSTEDDPYLVFESLNAKGKPLTQADLIRNYFFMRIHTDTQESVYSNYWKPMQDLLGENLTEFIRHYLTKNGTEVKQSDIYFEIKDRISRQDPISCLKDLSIFSEYYARFLNPDSEKIDEICKYLRRLNRLQISTTHPFLLNCYHDWQTDKITKEEFISTLKIIENFIIRRFTCNIQTRGLNKIFASLYSQVTKSSDLASEPFVKRLTIALQGRDYPKDLEFRTRLVDVKLYGGNRSEKAKLILESIEESFNHKEQIPCADLSIEHIMPQTLNDWWELHLGEDRGITHELMIHSLGNLTLTAYNSELSNDSFSNKKTHFENSHLELNKYFSSQDSWRKEDIEKRALHLADIALKIWSYFGDESQVTLNSGVTGSTPKFLHIFKQEYEVKTWRDVLETTLNEISDIDSDVFQQIIEQFPRFVGWEGNNFVSSRRLRNGSFIELNLSADNIYSFCLKAIETAEISIEDWAVETVN